MFVCVDPDKRSIPYVTKFRFRVGFRNKLILQRSVLSTTYEVWEDVKATELWHNADAQRILETLK